MQLDDVDGSMVPIPREVDVDPFSLRCLRRLRAAGIAALVSGSLAPHASTAAITAPALDLVRVQADRAPSGVWARFDGSFPTEDLVQSPLEIQILIRNLASADRFVRFELSVGAFEGSSEALLDGFEIGDIDAVIAASRPISSARLLALATNRIEVLLPPEFPSGPAEAQLFLLYRGERLLSNPMSFVVPGVQP